jgi:hypothetical protein
MVFRVTGEPLLTTLSRRIAISRVAMLGHRANDGSGVPRRLGLSKSTDS